MSKRRLTAYFYLLVTSIIWGVAGPVIKFTLSDFPPLIFLTYRFALSAVFAVFIFGIQAKQTSFPKRSSIIFLLLVWAVLNSTVRLGTLFWGFDSTTSLSGTVIAAISPVFMALVGFLFLHERVTRNERIGMTIACVGTLISVVEPVFGAETAQIHATITGNIIVFISLLIDVLAVFLMKLLLKKKVLPGVLTNITFILGFVTILPIALYVYPWQIIIKTIQNASLTAHAGVWFMAFISGTFAYYLDGKGLKTIEMGEASLFSYLSPIWAAPLSLLWLHEKITPMFVFGAGLIAFGVLISEYKRSH